MQQQNELSPDQLINLIINGNIQYCTPKYHPAIQKLTFDQIKYIVDNALKLHSDIVVEIYLGNRAKNDNFIINKFKETGYDITDRIYNNITCDSVCLLPSLNVLALVDMKTLIEKLEIYLQTSAQYDQEYFLSRTLRQLKEIHSQV